VLASPLNKIYLLCGSAGSSKKIAGLRQAPIVVRNHCPVIRNLTILVVLTCNFAAAQNHEPVYALTVGNYPPGDTLFKQVLLHYPYIAEAVDKFGFEILMRTKFIQRHSARIFSGDSLLLSKMQVPGSKFSDDLIQLIQSNSKCCLKLEIFDVVVKRDGELERKSKKRLVYYIR